MIVIADNSVISGLADAGLLDLIPLLFDSVAIPKAVFAEGTDVAAPARLRAFLAERPAWLVVLPDPVILLPEAANLGPGEAAAISLAWELRETGSTLILDDHMARKLASALGLRVTGSLGLLVDAHLQGFLDFDDALAKLTATGFWLSPGIVAEAKRKLS